MAAAEEERGSEESLLAWDVVGELLRVGDAGKSALAAVQDLSEGAAGHSAWLAAAPLPSATRTTITGGVVDKVVNIARAEAVHLGGPPPPTPLVPAQLPPDLGPFAGRHDNLLDLQTVLLKDDESGPIVVVISGPGGVGKTRMAVRAAHRVAPRFPDGQLYLDLRGVDEPPPTRSELVGFLLRALMPEHIPLPETLEERIASLRSRLVDKRVLILLDNAASVAQIRSLFPGSSGCAVLITSRRRLSGASPTRILELELLEKAACLDLVTATLGDRRADAEPAAVESLIRLCGRLPLALHIVLSELRSRTHASISRLVARLSDEQRRLDEMSFDDTEVRSAFNVSYDRLSPDLQRLFRFLSIPKINDVSLASLAALMDRQETEVEAAVETLVDHHLVVAGIDKRGEPRYRMHDLVRLFARERLAADDPGDTRTAALRRYLLRFLSDARALSPLMKPLSPVGDLPSMPLPLPLLEATHSGAATWFGAEREALVSAVQQAHDEGLADVCYLLADALHHFFLVHVHEDQWLYTQELGIRAAHGAGDVLAEGRLMRNLGEAWRNGGRYQRGVDVLGESARLLSGVGAEEEALFTKHILSDLFRYQGRLRESVAGLEDAVRGYQELGNDLGTAYGRLDLGSAYKLIGDHDAASVCLESCLPVITAADDPALKGHALRELGIIRRHQGRFGEAAALLEDSLKECEGAGHLRAKAHTLRALGSLAVATGEHADSLSRLEESRDLFAALEDPYGLACAHLDLGRVHRLMGQSDSAVVLLEYAVGRMGELGDVRARAWALCELGLAQRMQGRTWHAEQSLGEAAALFQDAGHASAERGALAMLADAEYVGRVEF